jgi:hypothetical protein
MSFVFARPILYRFMAYILGGGDGAPNARHRRAALVRTPMLALRGHQTVKEATVA